MIAYIRFSLLKYPYSKRGSTGRDTNKGTEERNKEMPTEQEGGAVIGFFWMREAHETPRQPTLLSETGNSTEVLITPTCLGCLLLPF